VKKLDEAPRFHHYSAYLVARVIMVNYVVVFLVLLSCMTKPLSPPPYWRRCVPCTSAVCSQSHLYQSCNHNRRLVSTNVGPTHMIDEAVLWQMAHRSGGLQLEVERLRKLCYTLFLSIFRGTTTPTTIPVMANISRTRKKHFRLRFGNGDINGLSIHSIILPNICD
jgi:hypothetical protein